MIRNVIVISDTHCGSRFGICPTKFRMDGGSTYECSVPQQKLLKMWTNFWEDWVPKVTKGEPYIVVHNGDALEGMHHDEVMLVSSSLSDQMNIAVQMLRPIVDKCEGRYYQVRGTMAHSGPSCQEEEKLANILGSVKDKNGDSARWQLLLEIGGDVLIHAAHHIGISQSIRHESTAVASELVELYSHCGRWHDKIVDVVVRSHRHRQCEVRIATEKGYGISLVTPGWQMMTPFSHKTMGRITGAQVGGYLIRNGDEDNIYTRFKVWQIGGSTPEISKGGDIVIPQRSS